MNVLKKQEIRIQPLEITFASKKISDTLGSRCDIKKLDYEKDGERTLILKGNLFSETLGNCLGIPDY